MKKSVRRFLIKIARTVLHQVLQQLTQQLNIVQEEVQDRLRNYVSDVVGGCWTGNGADRFVDVINSEGMSMVNTILDDIQDVDSSLRTAEQIMDDADMRVRGLVDNLVSDFEAI